MKKGLSFTVFTPANIVTYTGMVLTLFSYYLAYSGKLLLAFFLFIGGAVTDFIDGFFAKNEAIQEFFGGRGKSELGAMLDPIRDYLLKLGIFMLCWISGFENWWWALPSGTALISIANYIFINQPLNKLAQKTVVLQTGRVLQFMDCILVGIWYLACFLVSEGYVNANLHGYGVTIMSVLIAGFFARSFVYGHELKERRLIEESKKQ